MEAAAHTKGGFGGVPQKVGKEFVNADKMKACALYRIAKDHGHKLAESRCTYLLFSMSKTEIDQSNAYSQIDHIVVETMPDAA